MSGAASTLHNININFAAAARGRCDVTHPPVEAVTFGSAAMVLAYVRYHG
jgi:hypothetical protein